MSTDEERADEAQEVRTLLSREPFQCCWCGEEQVYYEDGDL